jgi:hypothetical protein
MASNTNKPPTVSRPPHGPAEDIVISILEDRPIAPQEPSTSGGSSHCRSNRVSVDSNLFLEVVDISLEGHRSISLGRTVERYQVLNTLEAVPVVRENTIRVYCTCKVANIDLKSHLRSSGITDESLLNTLVANVDTIDLSLPLSIPSLRFLWCGVEGESRSLILPSYITCWPAATHKWIVRSTSRVAFGFLPGNSIVGI